MNKVFVAILRLGLPISGKESPRRYVVEGFPGADWAANVRAVFRFDPVAS